MIDWRRLDTDALAAQFRAAKPFPHVVIDGLVENHGALLADFEHEPHVEVEDEIFVQFRSAEPPQRPLVKQLYEALTGAHAREAVGAIAGQELRSADGNAYVYAQGHYLLPHSDSRYGRTVAYAYYVKACERGGELELFGPPRKRIKAADNRLVLFAVRDTALHQVREVLQGTRWSMAGWYSA